MDQTDRLQYELLDHHHAEGLLAALDDPRVGRYIGGPDVTTLAALHARIDFLAPGGPPSRPDERWINIVVRRRADGVIIGRLEATVVEPRAEIAYLFGPAWWGNGYATEGAVWLIEHLCQRFALTGVWACIDPANEPSQRLVVRAGLVETQPPVPPLTSYDDGDLVFTMPVFTQPVSMTHPR